MIKSSGFFLFFLSDVRAILYAVTIDRRLARVQIDRGSRSDTVGEIRFNFISHSVRSRRQRFQSRNIGICMWNIFDKTIGFVCVAKLFW